MPEPDIAQTHVTDEMVEALRSRIRVPIKSKEYAFNTEASRDLIRHYAFAIGDDNPLWIDEAYAKKTRWDGIIGPPLYLRSAQPRASGDSVGLPGVHTMYSGNGWELYMPVRPGDKVRSVTYVAELQEKRGEFGGRMFLQTGETLYYNQRDEVIAKQIQRGMRIERPTAEKSKKYMERTVHHYSPDEIKVIEDAMVTESRRGAVTLHWEDVRVGEELPSVVRGPMTVTDIIGFYMGAGSPYIRTTRLAAIFRKKHPSVGYLDPIIGVRDIVERVHWDYEMARHVGVPAPYDLGSQREGWLATMICNWMGDDGWLKNIDNSHRRFNIVGDTTYCHGLVTGKRHEGGEGLVDLDVWCQNQLGEKTTISRATVRLPRREG